MQAEQWGSSEPYPYYFLAKSRGSVSLAYLAAGKAVQKAELLRCQAAQHIQERAGDLREDDLERLKELSERIDEPLKILEDTLVPDRPRGSQGAVPSGEAKTVERANW